ncbi:MAG: GAF domain-containing protein [Anaerolineales bacterium]|nr:GAF domain-containing protein [Anaerolineales bacterium]
MDSRSPIRALQAEVVRLRDESWLLREELTLVKDYIHNLFQLQQLGRMLDSDTDVVGFLANVLSSSLYAVGARDGSLLLLDEDSEDLVFAVVQGEASERLQGYRLAQGEGIAGWVLEHGTPRVVPDVRLDPDFSPAVDQEIGFQTRTMTCVPLLDGERRLGVIEAINKTSDRVFTEGDLDFLMVLAAMVSQLLLQAEKVMEQESGDG